MDSLMEQGPCPNTADALLAEISQHPDLLPARYNWKGERRPYTRNELRSLYENIDADHLPHLLSRLIVHTDAQIPPLVPGIRSLLSTGGSSLLREKGETERLRMSQDNTGGHTLQSVVFGRRSALKDKSTLAYLHAKEFKGSVIRGSKIPRFVPSLFQELVIMNGHRFPTFCLLFDRTNNRIITGSDDYLIKIWSAQSGYLLFTLRGHSAVVTYMDLSTDNSMLATASDDGIVRVWDLKTSAPVAVLPTGANARGRNPISTVSFSPSPIPQIRYLIATSLDGYTWVWKYDRDTKKFTTPPTRLDCRTFNDSKLKCATWNCTGSQFAVAGTDLFIRVFSTIQKGPEAIKAGKRRKSYEKSKVESSATTGESSSATVNGSAAGTSLSNIAAHRDWGDPVLIAQLDGHDGVVTSLSYSRRGNRILSGSVDGFVRIWRFDNQSKMWTSIAIDVRDENTQADATVTAAKSMVPSPAAVTAPPNALSSATASNNLNSDTNNTDLVMNGPSTNNQTQATENTTDDNAQQSGEDSRIIPTMAIWSLDDSAVILTTSLGEIKIFDSVTGEWMHTLKGHSPRSSIYVVDVHPQDSRILMTAGYDGQVILWDMSKGIKLKSWLYPEQEFLDGRFSPDGMMFAVTDQEGKCILFGAGKNEDDYQDARAFVEQTFWSDYAPVRYDADHNVVDDTTQIAPHLMERTPILDTNGRDYAKQKGPRYGLDLPLSLPPGALEQEEALKRDLLEQELENLTEQTLTVLPTTDKRKLYKRRREFILEDDDDDDDPMTTEVPIVPLPNESSGEEYGGAVSEPSSSSSESEGDGDDSDLAPEDEVDPVSNFVANDDEDDDDYFAGSQGSRKRRAPNSVGTPRKQRITNGGPRKMRPRKRLRLRESDEEDAMEEDYDEESDFDDVPMSPNRKGRHSQGINSGPSGSKSQRSARPKSFANDDYPSDEALESSDGEDEDVSIISESSNCGSFSGAHNSHAIVPTPHSPKKKKQWRGNGRKKGKAVMRDDKAMEFQKWLPSDWIRTNEPRKTPYHPQVGDYVAYLRQGHAMYLNETPLRSKLNLKIVPYLKDPSLPWVIFGRVSRITYNVGPPTWCTITLEEQTLSSAWGFPPNPQFTPSRRRFEIEFHDLGDVPDFIVLYSVFQEGVNAQYNVGEQVWATFDGNSYPGTISDQVVDDQNLPDSLWMAFEISWPNNEDVTNLSPWEIQREELEDGSQGREELPPEDCERIEMILNHFLEMEELQIFKEPVDFEAYPDYCKTIAYPICLDAIQERVTNGYYRRTRAVQFDIELLEKNALTYNDPRSGIAILAKNLARIFKTSIANHNKPLPAHIKVKSSRDDEDDEFDGEGSENEQADIESEPELDLDEEDIVDEDEEDADNAFLDDAEESEDEGRTRSRSRASNRRNTRANVPARKSKLSAVSNGRRARQGSSKASTSAGGTGKGGRGRKAKKKDDDDDDDDDDGEWGKSTSRRGRGGSSTKRNGSRVDEDEDDEEYDNISADQLEDEDDDLDDFRQENYRSPAPSSRPTRSKRKKTQIAESDEDYVS